MKKIYLMLFIALIYSCKKDNIIPGENIKPQLSFTASSSSIIIGDSVLFTNTSTTSSKEIEYKWLFQGASAISSTIANPKVKYTSPGEFDVKLIIFYKGVSNTLTKSKFIKVENTINDGLLAYYPFNGNAKDMTGNGHDGTPNFATLTTDRFGNPNSAYYFDGTNSSIIVKDKSDIRLNNTDFTINAWVKLDRYDPSHGSSLLIKRGSGSANGWGTSITGYASLNTNVKKLGSAFFNVSEGNDPFAVGNNQIELDKWCMITVTYELSKKTISLYINGVLDNVTNNIPTPNPTSNADLFIGSDNNIGTTGYHVKGKIDDIGFYNRKLSLTEINRLYFNSNTQSPPIFK